MHVDNTIMSITENTDDFGKFFGELLRDKRNEAGFNQSELSFHSRVSLDTIRSIECGRIKSPGLLISSILVKALGGGMDEWLALIDKRRASRSKDQATSPKRKK